MTGSSHLEVLLGPGIPLGMPVPNSNPTLWGPWGPPVGWANPPDGIENGSTGCYESFVEDPARQCSREGSTSLSRERVCASAETETSAVRSMAVVVMM